MTAPSTITHKKYKAIFYTKDMTSTRMLITEYYSDLFHPLSIVTDTVPLAILSGNDLEDFDVFVVVDRPILSLIPSTMPIPVVSTEKPLELLQAVLRIFVEDAISKYGVGLCAVTLAKTDTCWTYCLKRTGYEISVQSGKAIGTNIVAIHKSFLRGTRFPKNATISTDHNQIEQHFDLLPIVWPQGEEHGQFDAFIMLKEYLPVPEGLEDHVDAEELSRGLQPGDLLLFTHRECLAVLADAIDIRGRLEATSMKIYRHVAVYEGDGVMSHLVAQYRRQDTRDSYIGMQIELSTFGALENLPTHVLKPKTKL